MDQRNLIHPMAAGDLVESACVLAIRERGMGAETETTIWECVGIEQIPVEVRPTVENPELSTLIAAWPREGTRANVTFRDRQTGDRIVLTLKAETPLLFTRISL